MIVVDGRMVKTLWVGNEIRLVRNFKNPNFLDLVLDFKIVFIIYIFIYDSANSVLNYLRQNYYVSWW